MSEKSQPKNFNKIKAAGRAAKSRKFSANLKIQRTEQKAARNGPKRSFF